MTQGNPSQVQQNGGAIREKLFCIGFQKTGTTSLKVALDQIGYRVAGPFDRDVPVTELRATYIARGLELAKQFDAVQDMPWALMFRELDAAFPGSKFVFTWRETDRWWASISRHFGANPAPLQQLTYGDDAAAPVGNERRYRETYEAHNLAVREYFKDRPGDLLVMNLEEGDGWDQLSQFLGRDDLPSGPFVVANTGDQRETLAKRIRGRLKRLGF